MLKCRLAEPVAEMQTQRSAPPVTRGGSIRPGVRAPRRLSTAIATVGFLVGCLPYSVSQTAQTVPAGKTVSAARLLVSQLKRPAGTSLAPGVDGTLRLGIDDRSEASADILVATGGLMLRYKRRVAGTEGPESPGLALSAGVGTLRAFGAGAAELTVIASAPRSGLVTPYAAVRSLVVFSFDPDDDRAVAPLGASLGVRIGDWDGAIVPELSIYMHDPRDYLDNPRVVVVPSIQFLGEFGRLLPRWLGS